MIRIDALWLAVEPVDMRAGADRLLARVVQVFGASRAHHAYLFTNARATRIKMLVHDGFGVWCAVRRLNIGGFSWPRDSNNPSPTKTLTKEQFDALVSSFTEVFHLSQTLYCIQINDLRCTNRCKTYREELTRITLATPGGI